MRGESRKRSLIVSGAVVLLCLTVIVGMTFALFTDTQKVTNHLQAGDLKITLKRIELLKTTLDGNGYLYTPDKPDTTVKNFTNPTDENVFNIEYDADGNAVEKFVPGSEYSAKMLIENNSDVAFGYWIEIVCTDGTEKEDLASQVKVYVNGEDETIANNLKVGDDKNFVGVVETGKSETFTVTVKFVDESYSYKDGKLTSKNDSAKGDDLKFDLIVYAIQQTKQKPTTTNP